MGTEVATDLAARITGATTDLASRMTGAIRDAATQTGAGFEYLLNTAIRESNLNPNAKAKTSSATGLFQFIDQTWLATMKQSGGSLGYGKYADAISKTADGRYTVNDPAMKREIFALRKDPTANAVMAGAFANQNSKVLTDRLGRKPTDGELYIAHFLGASGAARFITAAQANPNAKASTFFPKAAAANSSIFYDRSGNAKSLKQVYAGLTAKHNVMGNTQLAVSKPAEGSSSMKGTTAVAQVQTAPSIASTREIPARRPTALVMPADRVQQPTQTNAVAAAVAVAPLAGMGETQAARTVAGAAPENTNNTAISFAPESQGPIFRTLFHSGGESGRAERGAERNASRSAVAPVVQELWGARGASSTSVVAPANAVAPVSDAAAATSTDMRVNAPLDLFRFLRPSARG